ncbi:unnamed protein product (macronuclear) [Paramecium tetraurelia]|uniref:Casein kinase I n=1 Tax=Paramecium tetraurelia TaxID=5888 RepID=A0BL80_PARTE|nr:uncharacterized protein GSPATT00029929001 [Paramecium tetraurelia]CAK59297.1 unnamed protein product [Paramecium tetraurelia]|eukprot:XP_001426695.1 hypothetical protein (macronuclear) [Paramecium tetraurelia strain d4-2]
MKNRKTKKHQTHLQTNSHALLHSGTIIADKFILLEKVGQGSFGYIFKTENIETKEVVATKFEKRENKSTSTGSMLVREIKVLLELSGVEGFPQIQYYGRDENYNYCMITYLGHNLEYLLRKSKGFSQLSCLKLSLQLIERLESLHNKNIIHRDLKPENLVIGYIDTHNVYLIDFGLAKYFKDSNGQHIPLSDKKGIIGTARYASIAAHQGLEQSRKDDLESLGYVLIYLNFGKLPWMNLQIADKHEKYKTIYELKKNIKLELLTEGLSQCYLLLLQHAKSREFQESPNYAFLKDQFKKAISEKECEESFYMFDWEKLAEVKNKKQIHQSKIENPPVIRSTIKRSSAAIVDHPKKQLSTNLVLPEPENIENRSRNGVSMHTLGTSKMINYQVSQKNIVEVDKYRRIMEKQLPRGQRKSQTVVQQQQQAFCKETSKHFQERVKTIEQVEQEFEQFNDLDLLAKDDANLHFNNIKAFYFKNQLYH